MILNISWIYKKILSVVQLDWHTISATVINVSWVQYSITYVMSHIAVIRRTSRSNLDWSPTIFSTGKKVSFLRPIFHIHAIKKNIGDQAGFKIWLKKFSYFLAFYFNFQYFTQGRILNSSASNQCFHRYS